MHFKIKTTSTDFIVKEKADLPFVAQGAFGVYRLRKTGWNTLDVLSQAAKALKRPLNDFAYGGRKDRHAQTEQFITIKGRKLPEVFEGQDYRLERVGSMDRPMGPDLIVANEFAIVVRAIAGSQKEAIAPRLNQISREGFLNYFDDQRFGSYDPTLGFLAQRVLHKHFNGAVKCWLCSAHGGDSKSESQRKQAFLKDWKHWESGLQQAVTAQEKKVFTYLQAQPNGFLEVLKTIPAVDLSLFIAAYQSAIWNEVARRWAASWPRRVYPGVAGDYHFPMIEEASSRAKLVSLNLPLAAAKTKMPDFAWQVSYDAVLLEQGIKRSDFNGCKLRQAFFKSSERPLWVWPLDLTAHWAKGEKNQHDLTVHFTLPRGAYATMLLKNIFSDSFEQNQ